MSCTSFPIQRPLPVPLLGGGVELLFNRLFYFLPASQDSTLLILGFSIDIN
jgi:hypothetical protein